jgi:outer membrane protein
MRKKLLVASIAALASSAVFAHEPGNIILRAGAVQVAPDEHSSKIKVSGGRLPGTKATVNENTQIGLNATYIVAPHFGIELLAATPFTHDIHVRGVDQALGLPSGTVNGKFATTKHLPPTVSLQYFPLDPKSALQPYLGVGFNYTWFFDEHLTRRQKNVGFSSLSLSNSWGLAAQAGIDYELSDNLILNAAVWRININTKARANLNNPLLGSHRVKVDVAVDPWVYFLGVGYKF